MFDFEREIQKAGPGQIVGVMGLGNSAARVWRTDELVAVFRHQMAAPMAVDLGAWHPGDAGRLRLLVDAHKLLLKSFRDLFQHPAPPLELLAMVKDFAKSNRNQQDSVIPDEIATVLYYLSIAAALVRCRQRISGLTPDQLREGFAWTLRQAWIDQPTRELLSLATQRLNETDAPA